MIEAAHLSAAAPEAAPPETHALSLSLLLHILRLGRRRILLCAGAGLLLGLAFAYSLKDAYTASASFIPAGSSTGSSAAALMGQFPALAGAGLLSGKSQGDLYVAMLRSRSVSHVMVDRFKLKDVYKVKQEEAAESLLAKHSDFEVGTKDPLVTISVTDAVPERERDLAKGYLTVLQDTSANLAVSESSQRRLFYEQRLARERDELGNAEVALKQSQERSGLIAPAGQTASEIQTLASLNAQITDRQVRLAALLHDEADENPDVVRLRREIGNLQGQAAQLENGKLKGQFGRFSTAEVPELTLDYIRKTRDVKYHEALFDIIAKQYEAARLDEAKDAPLQVLDRATVPEGKSGPHRSVLTALGLLLGLAAGLVWTLLRAMLPLKETARR